LTSARLVWYPYWTFLFFNARCVSTLLMVPPTQRLEVTLNTELESVDLAESIILRVAEAAGFSEDDVHKLGMAVREGVVNAYNYGNAQDRQKKIMLMVEFERDQMVVHIVDEGAGFDLADVADPLAEENLLRTSGRGIFLMRAFTDTLSVRRGPTGGADLVMCKKLPDRKTDNCRF
jgi:serine/threonine-protein kinase RsbW